MHVGLLEVPQGLTAYTAELLRAWGLRALQPCTAEADPAEIPVMVVPSGAASAGALAAYARNGGTVICFTPGADLAAAAGLRYQGERTPPSFLRLTAWLPPGLAGELLPVVGPCGEYEGSDEVEVLGYLSRLEDPDGDRAAHPGLVADPVV